MNVTAHQEKKTGMKKAGERRKQSTDFTKAVCCPSAVVQGAARQKNSSRRMPGVTGTLGKANIHFDPTQTGSGTVPPR